MRTSIFSLFDDVFSLANPFDAFSSAFSTAPRQIRELTASAFPHTDIWIDKDKRYILQIALAGVPESGITLDIEGRYLKLSLKQSPAPEEWKAVQLGIKSFTELETSYWIGKYWDLDKLEAKYKDGLLTITIEPKEEVAKLAEKKSVKLITE